MSQKALESETHDFPLVLFLCAQAPAPTTAIATAAPTEAATQVELRLTSVARVLDFSLSRAKKKGTLFTFLLHFCAL